MKVSSDVAKKAKKIKLIILDVDGVLTDGRISFNSKNEEFKSFDVKDGHGIKLAQRSGIKFAIITGRWSPIVERRGRELEISEIHQNATDKLKVFDGVLKKFGLKNEEVAYIGDDVVDIPILKRVGLAATVADAFVYVKKEAHYITKLKGGRGAVREFIDFILKKQNRWNDLTRRYYREDGEGIE